MSQVKRHIMRAIILIFIFFTGFLVAADPLPPSLPSSPPQPTSPAVPSLNEASVAVSSPSVFVLLVFVSYEYFVAPTIEPLCATKIVPESSKSPESPKTIVVAPTRAVVLSVLTAIFCVISSHFLLSIHVRFLPVPTRTP